MPTEQRDNREPETIRIRQTDLCPPGGEPFNPDHCTTAADMRARISAVERELTVIKSAFVLNDLDLPDYDGHRHDHRVRLEAAKVMESYKITATHKVIAAIVAVLMLFFSTGVTTKIQSLVAQTKEVK